MSSRGGRHNRERRERERERNAFAFHQPFYSKMYSKMFPKTLIIIIISLSLSLSLSRSYTRGGEKIKQTHAPVPAALELRRAVVAKVKAHCLLCAEV